MALGTRPCGCVGVQPTIVSYIDGTVPPMVGNRVVLERPAPLLPWAGIEGPGIGITHRASDTNSGHEPNIRIRVSPFSPIELGFDAAGRLQAGPLDIDALQTPLILNGGNAVQGGLAISQGGVQGHATTVAISPSSSNGTNRVWIGADGGLSVDPPLPFIWNVVDAAGNTKTLRLTNTLTGTSITLGTV